jgi:hypothetical protein
MFFSGTIEGLFAPNSYYLHSSVFFLHHMIFFSFNSVSSVGSSPSVLVPGGVIEGHVLRPLDVGVEQGPDPICAIFPSVLSVKLRGLYVIFLFLKDLFIKLYRSPGVSLHLTNSVVFIS